MIDKQLFELNGLPDSVISGLASRTIGLWLQVTQLDPRTQHSLARFAALPWRFVAVETSPPEVIALLEKPESVDDAMVRRRGFVHVIDTDPSRVDLPRRCLPVFLLSGRSQGPRPGDLQTKLRRLSMLEELRRAGAREILVVSSDPGPLPPGLAELWQDGFRTYLTLATDAPGAKESVQAWLNEATGVAAVNIVSSSVSDIAEDVIGRFTETYPEERHVVRIRDAHGDHYKVDVTEIDEPERPVLSQYELIQERDLSLLMDDELTESEFVSFFKRSADSWRPYAAGLPWSRDVSYQRNLNVLLRKLDDVGAEANCIAYVSSEEGAGGSTLARMLAWEAARSGYPVLLAKSIPFTPDSLPIQNYLTRVRQTVDTKAAKMPEEPAPTSGESNDRRQRTESDRLYEAPWVIVFDSLHWQYRDDELLQFRNDMVRAGRPVCLLVVTGPILGMMFHKTSVFKRIGVLTHAIDKESALTLGRHLNKFLRHYGKERTDWQWDDFYEQHTVRYLEGTAAFWVTLSFWIQGQLDLGESIQEWIYRTFIQGVEDTVLRKALLEIAAMTTERLPLPETLLPATNGTWPVAALLEDARTSLGALGLVRLSADGIKYWALVHDVLGRFLINALFYDFSSRNALGYGNARDAEHLRFLLLRQIATKPALGERSLRSLGEDFATTILKIDPDHGHGAFAVFWREVLQTLDGMPKSLRDTSRVFRHHTAVSRRRIAKLDDRLYDISTEDRIRVLRQAVEDLQYAIAYIETTPDDEPTLNLLNSLANAYMDLADAEAVAGASEERVNELRRLADETTRRAYRDSPANSFVIETYVKGLLSEARASSAKAAELCVEALGILYSALSSDDEEYRDPHLQLLADEALAILLGQTGNLIHAQKPKNALDVLVGTWVAICRDMKDQRVPSLTEISPETRREALERLADPAGKGNLQVIRLKYDLTAIDRPMDHKAQIELLEQLGVGAYPMSPQLRLELAILLFQVGRFVEGVKAFRSLHHLWKKKEHFVVVPDRLKWLRASDGQELRTLHAVVSSDFGNRTMAAVEEFGRASVPLRPEEHGFREARAGHRFMCHASFGHMGPFLRPLTAGPHAGRR